MENRKVNKIKADIELQQMKMAVLNDCQVIFSMMKLNSTIMKFMVHQNIR